MDSTEKAQAKMNLVAYVRQIRSLIDGVIETGVNGPTFLPVMERIKKQAEIAIETRQEIDKWQDAPKTLWRK